MENNPKKSKAFIIAFILILLLLVIGYYLFTNRNKIFDAKGITSISKVFAPLLGTSKNGDVAVVNDNGTSAVDNSRITGIIITDQAGNKIVRAEAGENLKKGDVLYISGFNVNKDPIVMKAIASDKNKSLVFGVAGEDMNKGEMGNIIIEGILTGVPTNRNEGTVWAVNNTLYLSEKVYGGMTKNTPLAPNFVVPVGSVIKVDPINGSIRIGGVINNTNINSNDKNNLKSLNSNLLNSLYNNSLNGSSGNNSSNNLSNGSFNNNLLSYWNSIFGGGGESNGSNNNGFTLNPINLPGDQNNNFPTVTVTADKTSVQLGEKTIIRWVSTKTTSCNAGAGNGTGTSGSFETVALTKSMAYTVSCIGPGGSNNGSIYVMIDYTVGAGGGNGSGSGNGNNTIFPTITVTPDRINIKSGEETAIKWTSTNATSCTLSGGGITGTGINNTIGVKTGKLTKSMAYTVKCIGTNGSVSETAYVNVEIDYTVGAGGGNGSGSGNGNNTIFPTITVTPDRINIKSGEETAIKWTSTNATSCTLSGGGITGTGINNTIGVKTGKLTKSMAYTVKCIGTNGSVSETAYVNVEIDYTVGAGGGNGSGSGNGNNTIFPTITVTPDRINIKSGEETAIKWTSTNATSCTLSGGGITGTGINNTIGVKTGKLTKSMAYTVKCIGTNGSVSETAYVYVETSPVGQIFPTITINPVTANIKSGEETAIKWTSTNATSCTLSGGGTPGITGTGINNTIGVKTGKLTKSTSYTVKCTNANGSVSENAYVYVEIDYKFPAITSLSVEPSPKDTSSSASNTPLKSITIKYGGKATINWTSINTTKCEIDLGVIDATTKEKVKTVFKSNDLYTTPALIISKSYSILCTGDNGRDGDAVYINVLPEEVVTGGGTTGSGSTTGGTTGSNTNTNPSKCKVIDANPLTYTEEEQRQLDDLLRKFYMIASTLKTNDDLALSYREIEEYKALVNQVKYITKECYDQIDGKEVNGVRPNKSTYRDAGGVTTRFGNPWFKYNETGSYLPTTTMVSSCKYANNPLDPIVVKTPYCEPNSLGETRPEQFNTWLIPAFGGLVNGKLLYTPGALNTVDLRDFEKVLNIW